MDKDEVWETLMDPNNRIIKQIKIDDERKAAIIFSNLMGESVGPRKQFLIDHAEEAVYNQE